MFLLSLGITIYKWVFCVQLKCLHIQVCDPVDYSLPGSAVHGISKARILAWVAISFSGDLCDPKIKPVSPALAGRFFTTEPPGKPIHINGYSVLNRKHIIHIKYAAAAAAKSLQLCPTLCDPIDGSPPGSPVPGILQARTLEWVAISSNE